MHLSQNMDVLDQEKRLTVPLKVLIGIFLDIYKTALISILKLLRLNLFIIHNSFP